MNRSHAPISLLLAILLVGRLSGQTTRPGFQHFTVEDGLSQGSVTAILQDHKGFIWIGTHDGLNRFDGVEFRTFRHHPSDTSSLGNSWITSLYESSNGTLWVGTQHGLNQYHRNTGTFTRFIHPPGDSSRTGSAALLVGEVRTGSRSIMLVNMRGVCMVDEYDRRLIPAHHNAADVAGFSISDIIAVSASSTGEYWAGTSAGFCKLDITTSRISDIHTVNGGVIRLLCAIPGSIFGICGTGGVFEYVIADERIVWHSTAYGSAIIGDRSGTVWAGTNSGLVRISPGQGHRYSATVIRRDPGFANCLSDDHIQSLCVDSSGALWVGTYEGINRLDPRSPQFEIYHHNPEYTHSLGSDFILPIMEDQSGDVWFGTMNNGVSILRHGSDGKTEFAQLEGTEPNAGSLPGKNVRALLQDHRGIIWMGTDRGLSCYNPATKQVSSYPGVPPLNVLPWWPETICEDRSGTVWIGYSPGGLVRADCRNRGIGPVFTQFDLFHNKESGVYSGVNVIREGCNGILWIGTEAGLVRFDPKTGTSVRYHHNPADTSSLSNDNIWSILPDSGAHGCVLWIGTSQGLNRFNTVSGTSVQYLEQPGLPNAWIYEILRDSSGRLWMSTNHGLSCFDPSATGSGQFRNYDIADGLPGNEYNRHSACRVSNGDFLFGGIQGAVRFHPSLFQNNTYIPPVVLTSFSKFGRSVAFDQDIGDVSSVELNSDENVFSFEFVALNYTSASKNRYAYMLEGFDNGWVDAGSRRYASYTHLDPGKYTFRVKASNNDGRWNDRGITVDVTIHPPVWQRWWFRIIGGLVLAGMLAATVRSRFRRYLEIERVRTRIAQDLHDDIGSNLSSIALATRLLGAGSSLGERERNRLDAISATAIETVDGMRDMVWLLNPENDSFVSLISRMRETATRCLADIPFTFTAPDPVISRRVDLTWKRNVFLIFKESLTNILKHSGTTRARIEIGHRANILELAIIDDGKGFLPDMATSGNGLLHMRRRAGQIGAILEITSAPGHGTTIRLRTQIT
jgi:ligand-binding sensor domain-containing protein/signal transduction histidine kinase